MPDSESKDFSESEQALQECSAIVAIGASAGGLEVFTQILEGLPVDTGMGFVLLQHLAPQHDSQLSEILRRSTKMPVNQAREGMRIMPNSVYIIPPNTSMTVEQGILRLEPRHRVKGKYMVIDEFFSSLAADRKEKSIAVILSGSNEDGTAGIGAIKAAGGITFAQDLTSAEFPTMPMIAIASGYVDFVLSPAEIAAELVNISKNDHDEAISTAITLYEPDDQSALVFTEAAESIAALSIIFEMLQRSTGADFRYYKKGTIRRRMMRRMGLLDLKRVEDYATYLQAHPSEIEKLYNDLLINVTSFFRDPESFESLKKLVFPIICEHKSLDLPIRIWVAGCATGEEVYSIAISLLEFLDDYPIKPAIQIFATDISEQAITTARAGVYHHNLLLDVSPERLRRFFIPADGGYQISKLVRELCIFARQNLTSDPPFSRLDLISCRNMLIYLEPVLQKKVMPIFHYALNVNGFLMLGSSEGIGNAVDLFELVDKKNRIYKGKITTSRMNFNFIKSRQMNELVNREPRIEKTEETNLELLADQVILSRYAPAGVIINSDLEILQFRGQTSPYLEPSPGKASLNLLKMARLELRLDLRSAIYNARDQDLPIVKDGIEMSKGLLVKLDVIPLRANDDQFFLVLFESRPSQILLAPAAVSPPPKSRKERSIKTDTDIEVVRLTHELEKTKEYLRSIIDAQEANNQDLKVAGEEILSSNEELQSTNEELETAKEEIQATNEELGTINDELRSRNIQLHQVNNDMQNLLSSVNIPILMLSGDLRIRRFTPLAEQAFNLIPSDVGRPFSDIQINLDVQHIRDLVTSVIDTLIPYEQDVQDHLGNWFSLRIRPYRTTDNHIDGVVISLIDIDQLKRNAMELEAARNYATAIVETLHQPLMVLNADLEVITANRAFYEIFQIHPHQTEQQSIFALGNGDWNTPKLRSLLNDILLLDISVQDYEVTQNFAQLGTRTMLLNACRIEQGNVGQMILIAIEDITERNLQKLQLVTKNQELSAAMTAYERANRSKSVFLGNMSHELRTPLNAIMGFSQILLINSHLDVETQEYLGIILQSSEHLLSLIEDLLDISRIEANKIEIEPNLLSLSNFLEVTVAMVDFKAREKKLTFTKQFAPDLPETIYADEKRLRQVLLNLLSNAIKFTETGAITFSVTLSQSTRSNQLIEFAIADTGTGMSAAEIEKIFLPFEQAGKSEMRTQGAGLGLAISQNLVQNMGGEIKVISEVNVGSTFSFELDILGNQPQALINPATEAIALLLPKAENAIKDVAIEVQNKLISAPVKPLSILIAEDMDYNQMMLKILLESWGHEANIANNGLEAIAMLKEKPYDVILMDIQMPVLNGIEASKRIVAEWDQASRPYIVAVSAQEEQEEFAALGMDAYISKPIDFAQLEEVLSRV